MSGAGCLTAYIYVFVLNRNALFWFWMTELSDWVILVSYNIWASWSFVSLTIKQSQCFVSCFLCTFYLYCGLSMFIALLSHKTWQFVGFVIVKVSRFISLETRGPGVFSINQSRDPCRWGCRSKSWTQAQQAVWDFKHAPSPRELGGVRKRRGRWTTSGQRNNTGTSRSSLKSCSVWIPQLINSLPLH